MELTGPEKRMIACRAYGSYASIPKLKGLLELHAKRNRKAEDQLYIEFLQVAIGRKNFKWEDYEPLARKIVALHPDPFGLKKPKAKRSSKCRTCSKSGHTARSCPKKGKTAITDDDGIPRLTPGWDPSSDNEESSPDVW